MSEPNAPLVLFSYTKRTLVLLNSQLNAPCWCFLSKPNAPYGALIKTNALLGGGYNLNVPLGVVVRRTNAPLWVVANQTHPCHGDSEGDGGEEMMMVRSCDGSGDGVVGVGGCGDKMVMRRCGGG
ncbi:hypothetical protein Tco_0137150, partial [Tanacetum coccineum]